MRDPVGEIQVNAEPQQVAERHLSGRELLMAGSSVLALAGGQLLFSVDGSPVDTSGAAALQCKDPEAPGYNTIICLRSPRQREEYCASHLQEPEAFKSESVGSSTQEDYRISFREPEMTGCSPAGTRKFTFFEALRDGSEGTFERNSRVITVKTTNAYKANTVLKAPYDCATDTAGSAVRAVLQVTWVPDKSSGVTKSTTQTYTSKSESIC
jgi:hypothetical protein